MANFTKELKELRRRIEKLDGWTWTEAAKKHRVRNPAGQAISISKTPSASNAMRNIRRDLRRVGLDLDQET